jgi:hypothetical protein
LQNKTHSNLGTMKSPFQLFKQSVPTMKSTIIHLPTANKAFPRQQTKSSSQILVEQSNEIITRFTLVAKAGFRVLGIVVLAEAGGTSGRSSGNSTMGCGDCCRGRGSGCGGTGCDLFWRGAGCGAWITCTSLFSGSSCRKSNSLSAL